MSSSNRIARASKLSSYGDYLQFPKLHEVMTFATIGFEAFGPFPLFYPFFMATP